MKILSTRTGILSAFLIIAMTTFTMGCKKDESPITPSIIDANGSWRGKTSQNENISFTVSSDSVTFFKIKTVHPSGASDEVWWNPPECVVRNNSFSLCIYETPCVTDKFKSSTSSEGTFTSIWNNAGRLDTISGTWAASKQ